MTDPDGLDRALRDALRRAPGSYVADRAAQAELLSALDRRRSRRQVIAGCAVVLVLAATTSAVVLSARRATSPHVAAGSARPRTNRSAQGLGPAPSAKGASIPNAAGSAESLRPGPVATSSAAPAPASAGSDAAALCVEVQVSGSAAACRGAVGLRGTASFSARSRSGVSSPAGAPGAEDLTVGQSITAALPPSPGARWSPPVAVAVVPSASDGHAAAHQVLRTTYSAADPKSGSATASFVAAHPGVVELESTASPICAKNARSCGPPKMQWTLQILVRGS